jgi:maleamate amidohydrolase
MTDTFEDHCWRDVIPAETVEIYKHYRRPIAVGPNPALLAIDLYNLPYQGGPMPVVEVVKKYPAACGRNAYDAIAPTKRLFETARAAGIPILYSTNDLQPHSAPGRNAATMRQGLSVGARDLEIFPEFGPQAGDTIVYKQRASAFFGTPLISHLQRLGVSTIIIFGQTTSGCVRATTVDGYSYGFNMVMAEECCFDRSEISHKVTLFDLHHKYANVIHTDEIIAHLGTLLAAQVG